MNNLDAVLEEFDNVIGLDRLKSIHLNDSLNNLGAHKDRHARHGEGKIGFDAILNIINHIDNVIYCFTLNIQWLVNCTMWTNYFHILSSVLN